MVPSQIEDGLSMGVLQQPDETLFVLDEYKFDEGVLQSTGIDNLKALQQCIDFKTVDYQIPFGTFEIKSNFNFLIIGQVKSLLEDNILKSGPKSAV